VNGDVSTPLADHWLMRTHAWVRRCALVAAVLTTIVVAIAVRRDGHSVPAPTADGIAASAPIPDFVGTRLARHRYRHSVIAGGALTREELAAAMREDAVVANHHRAVNIDRVRAIVTAAPRMAYVSYRIGHRVYWTRKPVQIPAGETLLTDGVTEIRARCGNGVSDVAREPVSDVEPLAAELDDVEGDSSTSGERTLSNTAPAGTPFVPFFHLAQESVLGGDGATDLPEEIQPVSGVPLALLAGIDSGFASNDGTSLFDSVEPSARGTLLSHPVNGGRPFLVDVNGLDGPGNGSNGDGPHGGEPNGSGSTGGGSTRGGSNGGESNGGGSNGGGSNGGGDNDPGPSPTVPTTYPGSEDLIEDDPGDDEIPAVPEPGSLVLLGLGVAAAAARRRRRS
jgi:uncharacterized membrane protein YgcG